jgi:hypothetical protein
MGEDSIKYEFEKLFIRGYAEVHNGFAEIYKEF